MYPDFEFLLESIFNTDMPEWLSVFKTFGFLVALSFLGAAWTLTKELKRKEEDGLIQPTFKTIEIGKPASVNELLVSAILGFILGYKAGGIFGNAAEAAPDPMSYLLSLKGNFLIGIVGALILGYVKYAEKKKTQLPEPKTKTVVIHPYQRISEILMIAAIGGLIGAKVFNALETWDDFLRDPASILSSSGLTFYGGLIVATAALYYYTKKNNIPFKHLCDAAAPGLILAYGLGRLGCQTAGDGDWGIFNAAYVTDNTGALTAATVADFKQTMNEYPRYFMSQFGTLENVPYLYKPAPSWLPDWMFAMNYPHNVNNEGISIPGYVGHYHAVLPAGVFPTPLYEFAACMIIFAILWSLRKRLKYAWQMFGVYLIFNGLERFFIEKIRVNTKYDLGFLQPTQAEIISFVFVVLGLILLFYVRKKKSDTIVTTP